MLSPLQEVSSKRVQGYPILPRGQCPEEMETGSSQGHGQNPGAQDHQVKLGPDQDSPQHKTRYLYRFSNTLS